MSTLTDIFSWLGKLANTSEPGVNGTTTLLTDVANIQKALTYLAKFGVDFKTIETEWEKIDWKTKLETGLDLSAVLLQIIAIAIPAVALEADAILILEVAMPFIINGLIDLGKRVEADGKLDVSHLFIPKFPFSIPAGGIVPSSWAKAGSGMRYDPITGRFEKKTI